MDNTNNAEKVESVQGEEVKVVPLVSPKSRLVLVLLSLFLGFLAIDRFYAGTVGIAIAKLITGLLIFGFIWAIIDFFIALFGAMRDENGSLISKW